LPALDIAELQGDDFASAETAANQQRQQRGIDAQTLGSAYAADGGDYFAAQQTVIRRLLGQFTDGRQI